VALDRPDRDLTGTVFAACAGHLRLPQYAAMLHGAGVDVDTADPNATAKTLVRSGAVLHAALASLPGELEAFREAGVDEIVLNVSGVHATEGGSAALRELQQITDACRSLTTAS
jgi:hypothetical protein